ncbi:MAG: Gfo/Idh/MocA family oxidoreductase, partial [Verrucomicrobiota bacterium]
ARTSTDWREVVSDPEIDVVDICTPNDCHYEIAIEAARQGKAVLCEKPLAMNVSECEDMVAAVKKARVVNMVCHVYRRIPAMALAKAMIERGDLGDRIYHFRARYAQDWITDPSFPLVWRLQSKIAGSGSHGDLGAHIIDLGRYLVGEIKEVCGLMETFIKERPLQAELGAGLSAKASDKTGKVTVDDAVSWIGRFKNGALANLEATRFAQGRKNHITIEINGSKGSLFFDFEDMNRLKFYNADDPDDARGFRDILVTESAHPYAGAWWPPGHIIGYEHTFVHAFADFTKAVVSGKSVHPTFADGLANEKVLAAVSKSAKSRAWVKV